MRILTFFCMSLAACAVAPVQPTPAAPEDRLRDVSVCVVNDANALVNDEVIHQTFDGVSEAYRRHVGISFTERARRGRLPTERLADGHGILSASRVSERHGAAVHLHQP